MRYQYAWGYWEVGLIIIVEQPFIVVAVNLVESIVKDRRVRWKGLKN